MTQQSGFSMTRGDAVTPAMAGKLRRGENRCRRRDAVLFLITGGMLALGTVACNKPAPGPKRADHVAAHSSRYHPDMQRSAATAPSEAEATTTQPAESLASTNAFGGPVGCPVLFVNGDSLTVQEILEPVLDELTEKARTLDPILYANLVRRLTRQQIDLQVSTLVLYQEAKNTYPEKAIEAFDKEADRRIKEAVNLRFQGIQARYEAHLKSLDLTVDDVKKRMQRQVMVQQYMRDKFQPVLREPPRRQLLKYYETHLDEFSTPEKAELFLIEIPYEVELGKPLTKAGPAEIEAARKRCVAQLKRAQEELAAGVEFTAVAKTYSKGLKAIQGGTWGEVSPGALRGRWAKAAEVLFTLEENQVSGIVEGEESAIIVKCGSRTPRQQSSFEEAQARIIERVKDEQFDRLSEDHIRGLLKRATVRPMPEFTQAVEAAAPRPVPVQLAGDEKTPNGS